MWFIATLLWFMAMYPLYRAAMRSQYLEAVLLLVTLLPFLIESDWNYGGWFNIGGVPRYMFYFFGGILFFKYGLYRYARRGVWVPVVLTLVFALCFVWVKGGSVVTATAGILMSVAWGVTAEGYFPRLFSSFRDYSFQIFLIGIFPQMFLELFLWRKMAAASLQIPYYFISCAAAILAAVIISKLAEKSPYAIVRRFFGLK